MEVKIQKLRPGAVTPRRGSADAAGYDLYACPADGQCVTIAPHATAMIGTGLALAIPAGYFGGVFARSGLASKQGLRFALFSGKLALFSGSLRIRARIRRASRTCSAGCCPRTRAASAA